KTSIFSHPVYLFLRKFSLQDSRGGSTTGVRVAFNGIEDAENNTLLKLDEGSNTASGLGIEILDGNMRPVKLNDLHAGMQWLPLVPEQNNILPYSARLKSTQKSVNPGLVRASATFTLEFQ
ncbi:fimbrial protein, partial [Escherichia coli]|uniref:fimbrial protein n=1 Tax=Escherichia coli TaxID=562 RepID=UPI00201D278F